MSGETRVLIAGAAGRMGKAIATAAAEDDDIAVAGAFGRLEAQTCGPADSMLLGCDVVVDFSTAAAASGVATRLATLSTRGPVPAMVIGATGFTSVEEALVAGAAADLAIVKASNFSIGATVLASLVAQAAARLPAKEWDIEIIDAHHRLKQDAPSGTALTLGEAAAVGRGVSLEAARARAQPGFRRARREGEIGFAAVRAGGLIGEHSVMFAAEDELLMISHSARSRSSFARGALQAARWVRHKRAGLYGMRDVLADFLVRDQHSF